MWHGEALPSEDWLRRNVQGEAKEGSEGLAPNLKVRGARARGLYPDYPDNPSFQQRLNDNICALGTSFWLQDGERNQMKAHHRRPP